MKVFIHHQLLVVFMVIICSIQMFGCSSGDYVTETQTDTGRTETHRWIIETGFMSNGNLAFVVFEGGKIANGNLTGLLHSTSGRLKNELICRIELPTGEIKRITNNIHLYEYVDGKYRENNRKVTYAEVKAFMDSSPQEYTIDALLKFIDSHNPENPKDSNPNPNPNPEKPKDPSINSGQAPSTGSGQAPEKPKDAEEKKGSND